MTTDKQEETASSKIPTSPTHGGLVILNNHGTRVLAFLGGWHTSKDTQTEFTMIRRWLLPKGHIEKDETPESCAIREAMEEVGVTVGGLIPIGETPAYEVPEETLEDGKVKPAEMILIRWFSAFAEATLSRREKSIVAWVKPSELSVSDQAFVAGLVCRGE